MKNDLFSVFGMKFSFVFFILVFCCFFLLNASDLEKVNWLGWRFVESEDGKCRNSEDGKLYAVGETWKSSVQCEVLECHGPMECKQGFYASVSGCASSVTQRGCPLVSGIGQHPYCCPEEDCKRK